MKGLVVIGSTLACGLSLSAQINPRLVRLPDGSTEIRIRNDSAVPVVAYAVSAINSTLSSVNNSAFVVFADLEVDGISGMSGLGRTSVPLPPAREITVLGNIRTAQFDQPKAAGIFADGSSAGDPALLTRLLLRRSNMLLAVDTSLDALSQAGRGNTSRNQLIEQFRKMADSLNHWYLFPEQQVGNRLYQSIVGDLMNAPTGPLGTPFPPADFVKEETALLVRERATLSDSLPSLADPAAIGRVSLP